MRGWKGFSRRRQCGCRCRNVVYATAGADVYIRIKLKVPPG
jgi:hypothetical protein